MHLSPKSNRLNNEAVAARIERAKYLLANAANAAMATVNVDGSPHNTPFLFIHDDQLDKVYWGSHPDSLHCQNALRTGQIFVVLYESNAGGGLYIQADQAHELRGGELTEALIIHNRLRRQAGKAPLEQSYYEGGSPQRMYSAMPTQFYINSAERDDQGLVVRDTRVEVSVEELRNEA